jgi:HMG box factor
MVKSIPYNGKLKVLRCVAPPLREPSLVPPVTRIHGSIIAVEGDDTLAVNSVVQHLGDSLRRSNEFDVRVWAGPNEPRGHVGLKDFFREVAAWHEKSKEIIAFITGADPEPTNPTQQTRQSSCTSSMSSLRRGSSGNADRMVIDNEAELEEGEIDERGAESLLERKKEERHSSIERESEKRRWSELFAKERKIPLVLLPHYILHASDAWACVLPIGDGYSPADHWQWVATLWRGIVGADHTVYVKSADKEEPVSAASSEGWPAGKPSVEMKEEFGGLVIRKERDSIEEGALRRMAFEVGEWVRVAATNSVKGV